MSTPKISVNKVASKRTVTGIRKIAKARLRKSTPCPAPTPEPPKMVQAPNVLPDDNIAPGTWLDGSLIYGDSLKHAVVLGSGSEGTILVTRNGPMERIINYRLTATKVAKRPATSAEIDSIVKGQFLGRRTASTGSDPEIFVVDENNQIIPSWKYLPKPVCFGDTECLNFSDGFQAEFNMPPCGCHESLMSYIRRGLISTIYRARRTNPDARLLASGVVDIPASTLLTCSDEQAALGCAPSFNCYPNTPRLNLPDPRELGIRFAGFHIHAGHLGDAKMWHPDRIRRTVEYMDVMCGVVSVALLGEADDPRRRAYYGRAGEYRLPKWGIEYRTLSAACLKHPVITMLMLDLNRAAYWHGALSYFKHHIEYDPAEVQRIINTYDREGARTFLRERETFFLGTLMNHYPSNASRVWKMILEGAENYLDLEDVECSWAVPSNSHLEQEVRVSKNALEGYDFEKALEVQSYVPRGITYRTVHFGIPNNSLAKSKAPVATSRVAA